MRCVRRSTCAKASTGCTALATQTLGRDVLRGDLFLFVGRDCLRAKVLYFDGTGLCLLHKRLSKGRFAVPWRDAQQMEWSLLPSELALFWRAVRSSAAGAVTATAITAELLVSAKRTRPMKTSD